MWFLVQLRNFFPHHNRCCWVGQWEIMTMMCVVCFAWLEIHSSLLRTSRCPPKLKSFYVWINFSWRCARCSASHWRLPGLYMWGEVRDDLARIILCKSPFSFIAFLWLSWIFCVIAVLDVIQAWDVAATCVDFLGEISCIIKIPLYELRERIWISISK